MCFSPVVGGSTATLPSTTKTLGSRLQISFGELKYA